MSRDPVDVMTPRILVLDDERQIHASIRLRLGRDYELVSCFEGLDALERLRTERFDLCFVDIHMPHMNGFKFLEQAREADPALGFVIVSAFDSDENLRRAIPLQVFEFLGKPLPEREGFERRVPEWVERTRRQRREQNLADQSRTVAQDLATAQLAREVELVASETARDALLQTANLLTTIHAHLVTATARIAPRAKTDSSLSQLLRNLDEARKTADAAVTVAESFFNSAYASRDSSPAFFESGVRHAIEIARRMSHAEETNTMVDCAGCDDSVIVRDLTGIDFLLLMVPVIGAALAAARPGTTVRLAATHLARLDVALKDPVLRRHLWLNRKNAPTSQPGIQLTLTATGPAFDRTLIERWLKGEDTALSAIAPRGLVAGLRKARGVLGFATSPESPNFACVVILPT